MMGKSYVNVGQLGL
uniref:Uncharacterized protein n=1 Tax=Arundo donax TaxID=35708 RepID=A0A0A9ENR3_ARUDO